MKDKFVRFMQTYIELLTGGRKEYFIAIVDIEKHLAEEFLAREADYAMAWFERREYSGAVVLRNDKSISRIVLFSNDSVKMIDSLKDFAEYPAVPEDKAVFWSCLDAAFGGEMNDKCKKLLETVMEYRQVTLEELLEYLDGCTDKKGNFVFKTMVNHLYQLGLWIFKDVEKAKSRTNLSRLIRNSDPLLAEARLVRGITEKKVEFSVALRKKILEALSKNDLKTVFRSVKYDDTIEQLFKGSGRTRKDKTTEKQEEQEEQVYENSYEYVMGELPEQWSAGQMKQTEDALLETDNHLLKDSMLKYSSPDEGEIKAAFQRLIEETELLSLTEHKKAYVKKQLEQLRRLFFEALPFAGKYTPACLCNYAQSQDAFVRCYFALLGRCLADTGIARMCSGVHFLSSLQLLFCTCEEDGKIHMPFYHPLAGFYYLSIQKKYEELAELSASRTGEFWDRAVRALTDKEIMSFPVRYMLCGGELYQLDYSSLKQRDGCIKFEKTKDHPAASWVNIRLLNEDLLDYMKRQKYLSEIQVTIVDINDMKEIMSLTRKMQKFVESQESMIHKVVLNIVSGREKELKKDLQENMEMDLEYPRVMFRFTKEKYISGQEYDMEQMIRDSDLLFLADSSILYQKPGLKEWHRQPNRLLLAFEQFDVGQLYGSMDQTLEILWDSMHYMELGYGVKLAVWDTRELNQALLMQIRREIKEDTHRTVVLLSSNPKLMQHLYHLPDFQVRHSILSGQDMLVVNFHAGSSRRQLKEEGEASVTVALKAFLEGVTGLDEMTYLLSDEGETPEAPYLTISCRKEAVVFTCTVFTGTGEKDGRYETHYRNLMEDIVLLMEKNSAFKNECIRMLFEQADNITGRRMRRM